MKPKIKNHRKSGRPRKGAEVAKSFSVRLEPSVKKALEKKFGTLANALRRAYLDLVLFNRR